MAVINAKQVSIDTNGYPEDTVLVIDGVEIKKLLKLSFDMNVVERTVSVEYETLNKDDSVDLSVVKFNCIKDEH